MAMQEYYKGFKIHRVFTENSSPAFPGCDRVTVYMEMRPRSFEDAELAKRWIDDLMLLMTVEGSILANGGCG
jgi:hypothetical protein